MPKAVKTGFRSDLSLVPFDAEVKKELKRMFGNYKSDNSPEIIPADVLKTFKKHDIQSENPSIYAMLEWIVSTLEQRGETSLDFE